MANPSKTGGRGRKMLKAAVRAGGLVVATGLVSAGAHAKDDDKGAASKAKTPGSTMAVKFAPNSAPKVTTPGSTMAIKQAPNSAMVKKKGNPPKP